MQNEYVKKLTGKNPSDFEFAAAHIINECDIKAFSALVEQSDFLFDFIKKNVEKRLLNVVTNYNYKNLLKFLTVYSADYEDFIISSLVKFADEDLTDEMLNRLENGTDDEKAYAAKYFSRVNDTLSVELLRRYCYSDFDPLAMNCAQALSAMKNEDSFNLAMEKIKSDDEFEKLSAVKFLTAYGDSRAVLAVLKAIKTSSMPENIASEVPYLKSFLELLDGELRQDSILAINYVLNGLGEILTLGQIFDFQLYDVISKLFYMQESESSGKIANVLLNAKNKFNQLTENDEYIFDEDKDTKAEIYEIKNLLNSRSENFWQEQKELFALELSENSDFVFSALELVSELGVKETFEKLKDLLSSSNQTLILKTVEVIKSLNMLENVNKDEILTKITDENIKTIIQSLF